MSGIKLPPLRIPVWSKLTRIQRILLVTVTLLVVLYIAALGTRNSESGSAAEEPGGLVGWLGDRLAGSNDVARSDLAADCFTSDTDLSVTGGTCTLRVAAVDGSSMRTVRLRAGAPVTVTAQAPGEDTTVSSDLATGDDLSVSVDASGGDIRLTCGGGDSCSLTLVTGD